MQKKLILFVFSLLLLVARPGFAIIVNPPATPPNYCNTPWGDCSTDDYISKVVLPGANGTGINQNSLCSDLDYAYIWYQSSNADLGLGVTYALTVGADTVNPGSGQYVRAWIDFNRNGVFDASEMVADFNYGMSPNPNTITFTVPANAGLGQTIMRIRLSNSPSTDPCGQLTLGETEDYWVTMVAPVCNTDPGTVTLTNITPHGATLSWNGVASQYLIEYGSSGFTPGTGTQVLTTNNPYTFTNLNPNSSYQFYVRNICFPGVDSSNWSVQPANLHTICDTPFLNLGPDTTICSNDPYILNAGNGTPGNHYQWNNGSADSVLWVTTPGTYYVTLTSAFGCVSSDTAVVDILPIPKIDSITAVQNSDESFKFFAHGVIEPVTYSWDFGDNDGISHYASPTYMYTSYRNYLVTLTVSNNCGIADDYKVIHFDPFDQGTGIHQLDPALQFLKVYPNPANAVLMVRNDSRHQLQRFEVYNVLGQRVYTAPAVGDRYAQIPVTTFAPGVYQLKIYFENDAWMLRKFEVVK